MHPNGLLSLQYPGFMNHHTGLMQGGLTIQNEKITVPEVPVYFLVDGGRSCRQSGPSRSMATALGGQKLVGNRSTLL